MRLRPCPSVHLLTARDILGLRDGLKGMPSVSVGGLLTLAGLMERIHTVQGETDKLSKDNQMLQVYIDNLCVSLVSHQLTIHSTRNSVVAAGKR